MQRLCGMMVLVMLLVACSKTPQLSPLPPDGIVMAFGDSLTVGTGAGEQESYPAVLSRLIGRTVVNRGIPGEISDQGVQRLAGLLDRERPALLILCHGGNDLLGQFEHNFIAGNLRAMVKMAQDRNIRVILVAVPCPGITLKPPQLYHDVALEFNIPLERNIFPKVLSRSSLKSDAIHPNAAGYRMVAEALATLMKKSGAVQ